MRSITGNVDPWPVTLGDLTWPRTFPKWCNLLKLKANSSRHREKRTPVKFWYFQTFRFITLYCIQSDIWFSIPLVLSHCVVLYLCWCFDLQCSIYVFVTLYYIPIILCLVRKVWKRQRDNQKLLIEKGQTMQYYSLHFVVTVFVSGYFGLFVISHGHWCKFVCVSIVICRVWLKPIFN